MTTRPALVLVTSSFPTTADGSEAAGAFVADLVEELSGHMPVRVVAPGRDSARERWSEHVEVFRYATPEQPLSTLRPWHPGEAMTILQVLRSGARATEAAASSGPTAHVLALWALPCGEWARRTASRHHVEYSVWTLGSDIWSLGRIPLVRARLRTILRDASHCWSDGLKLADDTRAIAGREVGFLPSTRRIDRVRTSPRRSVAPFRLLFLGRWHPNKGVDLLLQALHLLGDEDWALIETVLIAGGGPLNDEVLSGVEALQALGRPVTVTGYLDRTAAEKAFLQSDWLLIPSRIESIPVVFSDAMKLGCPVIAMPVGDLPRLVAKEPVSGLLAESVSAAHFSCSISHALKNPTQNFSAGVAGRKEGFDLATVANRIVLAACKASFNA
ncbi:glycosyltransferase [Luteimonas sp. RIT-PG2_3]